MKAILALIKKDLVIEWRQRYAVNGILLHTISSVFVVFLSVKVLNAPTWNALFWLIMLFTSISAVAKSFIAESKGRSMYYFGIATAPQIIISKIIYNSLLMLMISMVCFSIYAIVLGQPVINLPLFLLAMFAGCIGFASTFTFISSIASKAGNSNVLMPVLSFPVILPLLLVLIKASKKAMDGIDSSLIFPDLIVLCLINLMIVALAYMLFPYLWKE